MNGTVRFVTNGIPAPQGSKTLVGRPGGPQRMRESSLALPAWRAAVATDARAWSVAHGSPEPFSEPVSVELIFWLPRPKSAPKRVTHHVTKPDIDKLGRAVLDALTGIVIRDDSYVTDLTLVKVFAIDRAPGCRVLVAPAAPLVHDPQPSTT